MIVRIVWEGVKELRLKKRGKEILELAMVVVNEIKAVGQSGFYRDGERWMWVVIEVGKMRNVKSREDETRMNGGTLSGR